MIVPLIAYSLTPALIVLDRQTGETQVADVLPNGTNSSNGSTPFVARLSADGRFIVFASTHNGLDAGVTGTNGGVYIRDLLTGVTRMVSRNSTTGAPVNHFHGGIQIAISSDARYVAFTSDADNLVSGITVPFFSAGYGNLYLWDRETGETRIVSRSATANTSGNGNNPIDVYQPQFSAAGSTLVYSSPSSDLVAGVTDTNNAADVFAYDIVSDTNILVSVSTTAGDAGNAASANDDRPQIRVSSDGRFIYFRSSATNLTPLNTFNRQQIYVRDLVNNTTQMMSVNSAGTAGGNNHSHTPSLSADGKRLLFQSTATDLSPIFHGTGGVTQVYVRDLQTNTNELVSINAAGTAGGNHNSGNLVGLSDDPQAKLSADGRFVAFHSRATDLVEGYTPGNVGLVDLFLRDLETETTVLVTYDYSGIFSSNISQSNSRFRLLGDTVIFDTEASNLSVIDRNRGVFSSPTDVFAFTYVGAGSIAGRVFNDVDGNEVQNGAEAGISFWTVFIDANGNRRFDDDEERVFTNLEGDYRFTNLASGTYSVGVVFDDGFVPTTPASPFFDTVTLASNTDAVTDRNFGAQLALADLAVGEVTAPATALSGSEITVSWLVRNIAGSEAAADWQDAVYLSTDQTLDASDKLLATVPHSGGLGAFSTYRASAAVSLTAELPGTYFVLVQTNRRHQVVNDTNRENDILVAPLPTELSVPILSLNTPTPDSFTAPLQNRYVQVVVPAGQTLRIELDNTASTGVIELYVSRFQLPTTGNFEFAAQTTQPDQSLTIPTTGPGVYYILARSVAGVSAFSTFMIEATTVGLGIDGIAPNSGGNSGRVTMEINGTNFSSTSRVSLVSGSSIIDAVSINLRDATRLYAQFDLAGRAAGAYDIQVQDGSTTVTASAAFNVVSTTANPDPIQFTLTTPGAIRNGRVSSVFVEYVNTSDHDVVAPLLEVTATNAVLRLADQTEFSGDFVTSSVQFLGISSEGPAGILRPGQRGSARVYFKTVGGESAINVQFEVNVLTSPTLTIDWNGLKDGLRPAHIHPDAWDPIYANLMLESGTTVSDLQHFLARYSTDLSSVGVYTGDIKRLLIYAIHRVDGVFGPAGTHEVVDASFPAPGLELFFTRTFQTRISGRYALGPFGRGWIHNWDIRLTEGANGDVDLHLAGSRRTFSKQPDGSYLGSPGDETQLVNTLSLCFASPCLESGGLDPYLLN